MVDTQFAPLYDKIAFFSSQPARRTAASPKQSDKLKRQLRRFAMRQK